jgi:hypothetical protein
MRRRLTASLSMMSLLLCTVVSGGWLLSLFAPFGHYREIEWQPRPSLLARGWIASRGSLHVLYRHEWGQPPATNLVYDQSFVGIRVAEIGVERTRFGFAWVHRVTPLWHGTGVEKQWSVPLWLPAAVLAIPPLIWWSARVRLQRRRRAGRCQVCGYDLRATLDRCPECGTRTTTACDDPQPAEQLKSAT